jgi:prepilin-type N-terminal cleavage/methylation domain-containing protein
MLLGNAGFTLLELLVVLGVLSVLTAIAVQQISRYRSQAVDTQMRTDLKNAASAMESYYSVFDTYPTTVNGIASVGFRQTNGVTLTIAVTSSSSFTLTAAKSSGTQANYTFDSSTGLIN